MRESAVAMQFDDAAQQHEAAGLGMWTFLATEVLFFGALFAAYTVYRLGDPPAFAEGSRRLYLSIGAVNTAVLLTSSLAVAMSVAARHAERRRASAIWLGVTIALGLVFGALKGAEYYLDWTEHIVPGIGYAPEGLSGLAMRRVEMFHVLYFIMTGLHAVHVTAGVAVMSVLLLKMLRGRGPTSNTLEMTGLYWHFVDMVWIFLLPLLYMVHA